MSKEYVRNAINECAYRHMAAKKYGEEKESE